MLCKSSGYYSIFYCVTVCQRAKCVCVGLQEIKPVLAASVSSYWGLKDLITYIIGLLRFNREGCVDSTHTSTWQWV